MVKQLKQSFWMNSCDTKSCLRMAFDNKVLYSRCELYWGNNSSLLPVPQQQQPADFQWHTTVHSPTEPPRKGLSQGRGTWTSSTYWGWSIDDGDVVTVLESASNPSSTYCQDQDLVLKLKKRGRQWMASLHRIKWLNRHSDLSWGIFPWPCISSAFRIHWCAIICILSW